MGTSVKTFRDLKIWQQGIAIVKDIYQLSRRFPKEEMYGLTSQMRRAAISIPSNVAEGFKRNSEKEYRKFLFVALGSAAELETQVIISNELNYIGNSELARVCTKLDSLSKMIYRLISRFNIN